MLVWGGVPSLVNLTTRVFMSHCARGFHFPPILPPIVLVRSLRGRCLLFVLIHRSFPLPFHAEQIAMLPLPLSSLYPLARVFPFKARGAPVRHPSSFSGLPSRQIILVLPFSRSDLHFWTDMSLFPFPTPRVCLLSSTLCSLFPPA